MQHHQATWFRSPNMCSLSLIRSTLRLGSHNTLPLGIGHNTLPLGSGHNSLPLGSHHNTQLLGSHLLRLLASRSTRQLGSHSSQLLATRMLGTFQFLQFRVSIPPKLYIARNNLSQSRLDMSKFLSLHSQPNKKLLRSRKQILNLLQNQLRSLRQNQLQNQSQKLSKLASMCKCRKNCMKS